MASKVFNYITLVFCFLWAFLIFIDYWYYHPTYFLSLKHFQYYELTAVLALLVGGVVFLWRKSSKDRRIVSYLSNGLGILLLFSVITGINIFMHFAKLGTDIQLSFLEIGGFIGKIIAVLLATYFVYLFCFVSGAFILKNGFSFKLGEFSHILVSIALGIFMLSIVLFILGFLNFLSFPILWGLFIIIPLLLWKQSLFFIKATFLQKVPNPKEISWLGILSIFGVLIYLSLIYLQNIRPVPFGFDALAVYLNLPNLIYERGGLVAGSSPYYWSLFISLGYFLFDRIEVVISLSVSGGILSAFVLYELARKWVRRDYALLTILLFYSLPLINFQSYRDVKIDLGLLFMLLIVLLLLFEFYTASIALVKVDKTHPNKKITFLKKRYTTDVQYLLLMGLLSGMALGIKLTALILIFSIVVSLFYINAGWVGLMTSLLLTLFVILMAGLDVASGLRAYHFGVSWLRWVLLGIGTVGFIYMFYTDKVKSFQLIKWCMIYGVFVLLAYLPWPTKNYSETKSLSFQTFIEGKASRPNPIR